MDGRAQNVMIPHRTFWSEDYGPYEPTSPLSEDIVVDVAVIGAGFTGLSTALNLRQMDSSLTVAVVEQEVIGFGASGRNSGWVWPNVTSYEYLRKVRGKKVVKETYEYAKKACDYVEQLVNDHSLDSDYRKTGILRVAISPEYEKDMNDYYQMCVEMGREDQITEVNNDQMKSQYSSPLFYKGLWDSELALIHPVKHLRSLKKVVQAAGAEVYEQTPVFHMKKQGKGLLLQTPKANIKAGRIVLATGAYTHLLRGLEGERVQRHTYPLFLYNTMSRKLTDKEWADIGWTKGNGIITFGPTYHFGNPTADGRLHWCGEQFMTVPTGQAMHQEYIENYKSTLMKHTEAYFPTLKNLELPYHWGGAVSLTPDRIYHVGRIDPEGLIYMSAGCNGNGVSIAHLNGKVIAELMTGKKTELSETWFVDRKFRRWPALPIAGMAVKSYVAMTGWQERQRQKKASVQFPIYEQN